MKTEDFDDAIRRKLNSIQPTYKESEVDRVHNYVNNNIPVSFIAKYCKTLLVSATGLVVAGLIILNIVQFQKHDKLVEKIDTLEKKQENLIKQLPESKSDFSKETEHKKSINKAGNSILENTEIKNKEPEINTATTTAPDSKLSAKEQLKTDKGFTQNKTSNSNISNRNKSIKSNYIEKVKEIANKVKTKRNIENNKLSKNTVKLNKSLENEKRLPEIMEKAIDSGANIAKTEIKTDSLLNDSTSVVIEQEKKIPHIDLQKEDKKNSNLFSNLQFAVGLSAEKTNRSFGFGIPVQLAFSDNWSIYSGIKLSNINDMKFRDEREFKAKEGKEIRSEFGSPMPDSAFILNIERTQKLIQIPLALAYNIPLKNDFSLVASAGTDFNLVGFQSLSFENKYRNNSSVKKEIKNAKRPVPLFNNANVSFGLQKRWDNIILQANPYLIYHFRKADFKNPNNNNNLIPGINFRVLYCI